MKLYSIKNWQSLYETHRTRELKKMDWVAVPNRHDGEGYTLILEHPSGPAILGAWLVLLQLASKCPERGILRRDTGLPHDVASICRLSRFPREIIAVALEFLATPEIQWLEVIEIEDDTSSRDNPATIPRETGGDLAQSRAVGKGREGKEGKGRNAPVPFEEIMPMTLKQSARVKAAWALWCKDVADRGKPINANSARIQFADLEAWGENEAVLSLTNAVSGRKWQPWKPDAVAKNGSAPLRPIEPPKSKYE